MRKILSFFLVTFLLVTMQSSFAQINALTVSNLTPEYKSIIENVKKECSLNADQTKKFTVDYVDFINKAKANDVTYANNEQKRKDETLRLLYGVSLKLKTYLNADQQTKLAKLIQAGKLTPKAETTVASTSKAEQPVVTPGNEMPTAFMPDYVTNANVIKPQSNVADLFEQLKDYLKISPDQLKKSLPILKDYDKKIIANKTLNAGNEQKIKQETDKLNSVTVPKLKEIISQEQLNGLVLAMAMQENILSGKNVTPQQKQLIDKVRKTYKLNDAQTMAVIIVMVQAKLRGDIINATAKSNPADAKVQSIQLMKDLDAQLMSALETEQYEKVKADIEKIIEKK